jgi:hypothetical protein
MSIYAKSALISTPTPTTARFSTWGSPSKTTDSVASFATSPSVRQHCGGPLGFSNARSGVELLIERLENLHEPVKVALARYSLTTRLVDSPTWLYSHDQYRARKGGNGAGNHR